MLLVDLFEGVVDGDGGEDVTLVGVVDGVCSSFLPWSTRNWLTRGGGYKAVPPTWRLDK